jgi:CBS domain-containing protein
MKVSDAMTPEVQLCTPDDTLKDAAQAMAALGVGLLPVTDNDRLVGMISDRDIAIRGIGMGRGPEGRVGDVMTADVKYCYDDQDLDEVSANMGDIQVRRLPVLTATSNSSASLRWVTSRWCRAATARARRCAEFRGPAGSTSRFDLREPALMSTLRNESHEAL